MCEVSVNFAEINFGHQCQEYLWTLIRNFTNVLLIFKGNVFNWHILINMNSSFFIKLFENVNLQDAVAVLYEKKINTQNAKEWIFILFMVA